jgi:hypothetical protein
MTFFDTLAAWTERDWLECVRPHDLLYFLGEKASDRKLRLFGCACVRRFWHELKEQSPEREGIEIAERFADGLADMSELQRINKQLGNMCWGPQPSWGMCTGAVWELTAGPGSQFGIRRAGETAGMIAFKAGALGGDPMMRSGERPTFDAAEKAQAAIVRDLFCNPFRPVALSTDLLSWNNSLLASLAQSIYDAWAFERFPILADALEEAGCTDQAILDHLRGPGPHARGCWAVDQLLKKE